MNNFQGVLHLHSKIIIIIIIIIIKAPLKGGHDLIKNIKNKCENDIISSEHHMCIPCNLLFSILLEKCQGQRKIITFPAHS